MRTVDVDPEDRRKFALTDEDVIELAKFATIIEKHYGRPMDIEWGADGIERQMFCADIMDFTFHCFFSFLKCCQAREGPMG